MNKNYGFIIHPENMDDLLKLHPTEAGYIVQNMILTFKGEEPKKFDDRFLDYVSDDLCGRVKRDMELSEKQSRNGKKGGAPKGNTNAKTTQNNPNTTQKQAKTNPNTNTNTNTNINNIGFKPNAFTSGCTNSPIDFEELEKTLIKNQ